MATEPDYYRERDRRFYKAGGGVWFRNTDKQQILVLVQLYPSVRLWFYDEDGRHDVTKEQLERDYHRLRL